MKKILAITFVILGLSAALFYLSYDALTKSVTSLLNEQYCQILLGSLKKGQAARITFYPDKLGFSKIQSKYLYLNAKDLFIPVSMRSVKDIKRIGIQKKTLDFQGYQGKPLFMIMTFNAGGYRKLMARVPKSLAMNLGYLRRRVEAKKLFLWIAWRFEGLLVRKHKTPLSKVFWRRIAMLYYPTDLAVLKGMGAIVKSGV